MNNKFAMAIALAVSATIFGSFSSNLEAAETSDFTWADKSDFDNKRKLIDKLGRRHFGSAVKGTKADLDLLQRIADRRLIKQEDIETLQATGIVLGDVLKSELDLEWKVYEDNVGRSRALCVKGSSNCLFPITMLSRRLEVGLKVDVDKIYSDAVAQIDPFLPDSNAYDGVKPDPTPKPSWTNDRKKSAPIPIRMN